MRYNNILEAIGRTPLIRLNKITRGLKPSVYVKAEYLNPGGSIKDRIAVTMIDEAEKKGLLKPGGTIIEGTSGNTGMGLALLAAVRGYKVIFTITDKQSREKINLLKALGAEVIVCPTAVAPEDPRSYYSVARKLSHEIPNSFYPNQYDNMDNMRAHFETTGPEIWEDTEGKITHFVAGMGTGGTISGIGKFLKGKNPKVRVIGADPMGSLYHEFFHTGKVGQHYPYKVEGIGEDIFPKNMDFTLVDDVVQVSDKDSFLWARKLAREEGIFGGGSTGSALWAALQVARTLSEKDWMVVLIPDTGHRYLSKVYNDEWMKENQFLESELKMTARDILSRKERMKDLVFTQPHVPVFEVMKKMQDLEISQLPVFEDGEPVGAIYEDHIMQLILHGDDLKKVVAREIMGKPFPVLPRTASVDQITSLITADTPAVFVEVAPRNYDIITKFDLLRSMTQLSEGKR